MKLKSNEQTCIHSFILTLVFHFTLLLSTPPATAGAHQFPLSSTGFIPHLGHHNDAAFTNQPQTQAKASAASPSSQETQAKASAASTSSQKTQAKASAAPSSQKTQAKASAASTSSQKTQAKASAAPSSQKTQAKASAASTSSQKTQAKASAAPSSQKTQAKASAAAPSSQKTQAAFSAQAVTTMSTQTGAHTIGLASSGTDSAVQSLHGTTSQTPTANSTSQPSTDSISNTDDSPSQSLPGTTTNKPRTGFIAQILQVHRKRNPASLPNMKWVDPEMKGVCHSTDYPDVCISSIRPLLSGKPNVISMLQMAIKACATETKLATAFAHKLVSSSTTNTLNDGGMSICEENYIDMLDNLKSASDAIPSRDVGTINSMLSAVISDLSTCEDGFDGHPSPMMQFYDKLKKMASNCLAIATLVK